jgi:hypothetical protein
MALTNVRSPTEREGLILATVVRPELDDLDALNFGKPVETSLRSGIRRVSSTNGNAEAAAAAAAIGDIQASA